MAIKTLDGEIREERINRPDLPMVRRAGESSIEMSARRQHSERAANDPEYAKRLYSQDGTAQYGYQAPAPSDPFIAPFGIQSRGTNKIPESATSLAPQQGAIPNIFAPKQQQIPSNEPMAQDPQQIPQAAPQTAQGLLDRMGEYRTPEQQSIPSAPPLTAAEHATQNAQAVADMRAAGIDNQRIPKERLVDGGTYTPAEKARAAELVTPTERLRQNIKDRTANLSMQKVARSLLDQGVSKEAIKDSISASKTPESALLMLKSFQKRQMKDKSSGMDRAVDNARKRARTNPTSAKTVEAWDSLNEPSTDPSKPDEIVMDNIPKSQQKRVRDIVKTAGIKKVSSSDQEFMDRTLKVARQKMEKRASTTKFERVEETRQQKIKDVESKITDREGKAKLAKDKTETAGLYKKWQDLAKAIVPKNGAEARELELETAKAEYEAAFDEMGNPPEADISGIDDATTIADMYKSGKITEDAARARMLELGLTDD